LLCCLVEGVDDLAETDVDFQQGVAACCIGEEALFDGDADLAVYISELVL
jgi:hypothetical protein